MSDKKETPVSWLVSELIEYNLMHKDVLPSHPIFEKALKMESKKQQKYDEMLEMLQELFNLLEENQGEAKFYNRGHYIGLKQLIKEAKEL
jgi:hypothetical protein